MASRSSIQLTVGQIVEWAKQHRARTGSWPTRRSGPIHGAPGSTWLMVNSALVMGYHGLPGQDSLARLLHRNVGRPEGQTIEHIPQAYIQKWADAYYHAHQRWPSAKSGLIPGTRDMSWSRIDSYLRRRGSPDTKSLARFLLARRGSSGIETHPPFKLSEILAWARAFHRRQGQWPRKDDDDSKTGRHWSVVDYALQAGRVRGIARGTTLAVCLFEHCSAPYKKLGRAPLTLREVLTWADRHQRRTARWPTRLAGRVVGGPKDLTWAKIDGALHRGGRGLPKEKSLVLLLMRRRGARHSLRLPQLRVNRVLAWADAYHQRHGRWPTRSSGRVVEAPENTWSAIHFALKDGGRGLPRGSSLWKLFRRKRGVARWNFKPTLTEDRVIRWARAYHRRKGVWPTHKSGIIKESPDDTWCGVDLALRNGLRGLKSGQSLSRLLNTRREVRPRRDR